MPSNRYLAFALGVGCGFALFVTVLHKRGWSIWQRWDHEPWESR